MFATLVEKELLAVVKLEAVLSKLVVLVERLAEACIKILSVSCKFFIFEAKLEEALVKTEEVVSVLVTLVEKEDETVLNDPVCTNTVESKPSNKLAFEAYEAVPVKGPIKEVAVTLPVTLVFALTLKPVKLTDAVTLPVAI